MTAPPPRVVLTAISNRAIALKVLQDRLMLVPANTKAQLVGTDTRSAGLIKIKIIEGKYSGESGSTLANRSRIHDLERFSR